MNEEKDLAINLDEKFNFVKLDDFAAEHIDAPRYSYWKSVWRKFFSNKIAVAMLVLFTIIVLFAFIQPLFSNYDPMNPDGINDFYRRYNWPSWGEWFGTDANGQSLFDAVWAGTKTSLSISLLATLITTVLGVSVGAVWGFSKSVDRFMLEVYNIVSNVPTILIVFVLVYAFTAGFWSLLLAMCLTTWVGTAYFIRVQVMIMRDREYNLASHTLGTPMTKLITKNIIPFLISVLVTDISRTLPAFIGIEAFLSFLGVGLDANTPSLGKLISKYSMNITSFPYLFWIPVTVLALITVSTYLAGQALADASDPKTHM